MRRLRVGVLDLLSNDLHEPYFQRRVLAPNYSSVMPQCVGVWAEELGHQVFYETFTGREEVLERFPEDLDVLFISCFSRASFLAYGLSQAFRRKGVVTVLGGPHARSFFGHARRYFDYVCLLTDRELIRSLLSGPSQQRQGLVLEAPEQPRSLPGLRERSRFVDVGIRKSTFLFRAVPILGSLGCPYSCGFCVDASIPYRPLPFEGLVDDLRCVEERYGQSTMVGWHDPNFGVRFKDYMRAIDLSGTRLMHVAESSLSILSEARLRALEERRFVAMLPGIESWFDCGPKGGAAKLVGEKKALRVAEHLNLVQRHIPYVQANFVLGLDSDSGDEPWSLTKRFVELSPGVLPTFSLMTDFGNAPLSEELRAQGRTLRVPYPLLDNNFAVNITLKHYSPLEFYDRVIDLNEQCFSRRAFWRRFRTTPHWLVKLINLGRAMGEGRGRLAHYRLVRERLAKDQGFHRFAKGEQPLAPESFFQDIRRQLGRYQELVPPELLTPEGFLGSVEAAEGACARAPSRAATGNVA
ncbi:MAG: radical SAM protein [Myxococcales bacterium]|nr:radical SAM protein [Myxococcales bacterium]